MTGRHGCGRFFVVEDDCCMATEYQILKPVPQWRSRSNIHGNHYNPSKRQQEQFKTCCMNMFCTFTEKAPPMFERIQPLKINIEYYLPHSKTGKRYILNKSSQSELDNLMKFTLDALVGVFYHDDIQVCETSCSKRYEASSPTGWVVVKLEKTSIISEFMKKK